MLCFIDTSMEGTSLKINLVGWLSYYNLVYTRNVTDGRIFMTVLKYKNICNFNYNIYHLDLSTYLSQKKVCVCM